MRPVSNSLDTSRHFRWLPFVLAGRPARRSYMRLTVFGEDMLSTRDLRHRSRRRELMALLVCATISTPTTAWSQRPSLSDLPSLLECKTDVASYLKFRHWISKGGADFVRAGYAWRKTNVFQAEYGLSHPVSVFGMQARVVGLTDNGVLAEVAGTTPRRLAQRLGVDPLVDATDLFVANKLVGANDAARAHAGQVQVAPTDVDALLGVTPTKPAYDAQEVIQVVTNLGQAGKTMVGCNYIRLPSRRTCRSR